MNNQLFLSIAIFCLFFSACNTNKLQIVNLENTKWQLKEMPGVKEMKAVTLEFSDSKISGKSFCNQYFSNYNTDAGSMKIEAIGASKRACPQMNAEQQFFTMLARAESYSMKNNDLYIKCEKGILVFESFSKKSDDEQEK